VGQGLQEWLAFDFSYRGLAEHLPALRGYGLPVERLEEATREGLPLGRRGAPAEGAGAANEEAGEGAAAHVEGFAGITEPTLSAFLDAPDAEAGPAPAENPLDATAVTSGEAQGEGEAAATAVTSGEAQGEGEAQKWAPAAEASMEGDDGVERGVVGRGGGDAADAATGSPSAPLVDLELAPSVAEATRACWADSSRPAEVKTIA
jgi:hypothetical protein